MLISRILKTGIAALLLFTTATAAEPEKRYFYLFPKPMDVSTELGPFSRTSHVLAEGFYRAVRLWGAFNLMHLPPIMGIPPEYVMYVFAVNEVAQIPISSAVQSGLDLQIRSGFKMWQKLRELKNDFEKVPGLRHLAIMSSSDPMTRKVWLAHQLKSRGFVFMEASEPLKGELPAAIETSFGVPEMIEDPENAKFVLKLESHHKALQDAPTWEAPLEDILSGKPMPKEIAEAWRQGIANTQERSKLLSFFRKTSSVMNTVTLGENPMPARQAASKEIQVLFSLKLSNGQTKDLGVFAEGPGVRKLLGMGIFDQALRKFRGGREKAISLTQRFMWPDGQLRSSPVDADLLKYQSCVNLFRGLAIAP